MRNGRRTGFAGLFLPIVIALLMLAMTSLAWSDHRQAHAQSAHELPDGTAAPLPPEVNLEAANRTFVDLAEELKPTVVFIDVVKTIAAPNSNAPFAPNDPFWDFFRDLVPPDRDWRSRGLGSGFIIDPEGYIVTNNHVVDSAQTINVKLLDGTELEAELIGSDAKSDLALIKVQSERPLPAIKLGDSDALKVGEWVIAIGNPLGLDYTVTAGIVSAKGRMIGAGPYDDFIQTDASINPGNSGGPLINIRGQAVGVNTLIISGGQNLGFAIPINMVREIIGQLRTTGRVVRGWLGVEFSPLTRKQAQEEQVPIGAVLVQKVVPGGPAERAGIKPGDVLIEFDGKRLARIAQLPLLVAQTPVGDKVDVVVARNGQERTLNVLIAEMPPEGFQVAEQVEIPWGLTVSDLTPDTVKRYNPRQGAGALVVRIEPGSVAQRSGVQVGDLIHAVDRIKVMDVASLKAIIDRARRGEKLLFVIDRNGQALRVTLRK
ncbi:MAG: Do family serine endopeptidase [Candidatus Alcyoniella australis]|nr:Do family serine endopeptidase [Candidatus Alcyoniella australis]